MPSRIIREQCLTSPTLAAISAGAERMFWRLVVVADDHGRFDAMPEVLLSKCFPRLVKKISITAIQRWAKEMVEADLIRLYIVSGSLYGVLTMWHKHQRARHHAKHPDPPRVAAKCGEVPPHCALGMGYKVWDIGYWELIAASGGPSSSKTPKTYKRDPDPGPKEPVDFNDIKSDRNKLPHLK